MTAREQFPPLPKQLRHWAGAVPIKRSIAAARKAGVDVAGIEVLPDGTIRLLDARLAPKPTADLFEELEQQGKI